MGALSDRWEVFQTAVGSHRYALADLAKLAVGVAAFVIVYLYRREMTTTEIVLFVLAFMAVCLFWIMLEYALKLRRQISDARVQIAELRHKGVRLRNDALGSVVDKASWQAWEGKALAWNKKVIREIKKISEADAVWFSILDVVPLPRLFPVVVPVGEMGNAFFKLFR